jgi:transcriptional regulator with XRE-family HTH domain
MTDRATLVAAVADALVQFRTQAGRDLDEVAHCAAIEPERLSSAEDGEIALEPAELDRLAEVYGIDVSAFFGGRTTPLAYLAGA